MIGRNVFYKNVQYLPESV